jgi:hypothetical protein
MAYKPWKPWHPPLPPAGSYDPGLDSQLAAGGRGLQDLRYDTGIQGGRNRTDYELQRGDVQQGYDRGVQDLGVQRAQTMQGFDRSGQDLATARTRGTEDYNSNVALLQRSYSRLAGQQQQQQNQAGVLRGGAVLQAAAKRAANEATDRQPLDRNYQRFLGDNTVAGTRLGEDRTAAGTAFDTQGARLGENRDTEFGRLGLQLTRGTEDLTTALSRATREQKALGIDTTAAQAAQASAGGWAPPGRGEKGGMPSNEYVDRTSGEHRRIIIQGNERLVVGPDGRVLDRRRR